MSVCKITFTIAFVFSFLCNHCGSSADNVRRLHAALAQADIDAVVVLLEGDAVGVNDPDRSGKNALHIASARGHKVLVQLLLDRGADANARNALGRTPLYIAANCGHAAVVRLLLAQGACVNAREHFGKTALHTAAERGYVAVVQALLDGGASVHMRDRSDRTPLRRAVVRNRRSTAQLLVNEGSQLLLEEFARLVDQGKLALLRVLAQANKDYYAQILSEYLEPMGLGDDVAKLIVSFLPPAIQPYDCYSLLGGSEPLNKELQSKLKRYISDRTEGSA